MPESGASSPDSIRINVDLPVPFGPTSAMRSPRSMCSDTSRNTVSLSYALRACFSSRTVRPLFTQSGKAEVNPLALGRNLDRHHLIEQLDAALHLRRLRGLVAEAIDEHLDARDFLVLLPLRIPESFEHGVAQLDILAVVADVVGELPQMNVGDPRHDRIEEVAIVRDENHGEGIRAEIFLEPVARLEIEMVRRLVEQQEVRPAEQQLRQRDPHLPAT